MSYRGNIVGRRDGGGNDRVEENERKEEVRDVRHARCKGVFAPVHDFTRFPVDICIMNANTKMKHRNYVCRCGYLATIP